MISFLSRSLTTRIPVDFFSLLLGRSVVDYLDLRNEPGQREVVSLDLSFPLLLGNTE